MYLIRIKQGTTPLAKDLYIHCGGEVQRVDAFTSSAGWWGKWKAYAGALGTDGVIQQGGGSAQQSAPTGVCAFRSYGLRLGSNASLVRAASATIIIAAYLDDVEDGQVIVRELDLGATPAPVLGTGDQVWTDWEYALTYTPAEGELDWIRKQA